MTRRVRRQVTLPCALRMRGSAAARRPRNRRSRRRATADRRDVRRGAAEHRMRRMPDRFCLVAQRVDGDDGRLVDDDAARPGANTTVFAVPRPCNACALVISPSALVLRSPFGLTLADTFGGFDDGGVERAASSASPRAPGTGAIATATRASPAWSPLRLPFRARAPRRVPGSCRRATGQQEVDTRAHDGRREVGAACQLARLELPAPLLPRNRTRSGGSRQTSTWRARAAAARRTCGRTGGLRRRPSRPRHIVRCCRGSNPDATRRTW